MDKMRTWEDFVEEHAEYKERAERFEKRRGGECSGCGKWVCPPLTCYGCQKTPLAIALKENDDMKAALKLAKTAIETFFHHWKYGGISRDNQFHQNTAWHMRVAAERINAISASSTNKPV